MYHSFNNNVSWLPQKGIASITRYHSFTTRYNSLNNKVSQLSQQGIIGSTTRYHSLLTTSYHRFNNKVSQPSNNKISQVPQKRYHNLLTTRYHSFHNNASQLPQKGITNSITSNNSFQNKVSQPSNSKVS